MCYKTKPNQTHQQRKATLSKNSTWEVLDLGWPVLPHPLHSSDLSPSDFYLFTSIQNALNEKKKLSPEDQVKTFVKNLLSSKPVEFTLEESSRYQKNGKRWFKRMALIEINSMLNHSLINYMLLKQKLWLNPNLKKYNLPINDLRVWQKVNF